MSWLNTRKDRRTRRSGNWQRKAYGSHRWHCLLCGRPSPNLIHPRGRGCRR